MANRSESYRGRLNARRVTSWTSSLTELAESLSRSTFCPPQLYASLLERNLHAGGRVHIVEHRGEPLALIGLQPDGAFRWKPVANWLVPDFVCASPDEGVIPALNALGTEVSVSWWRNSAPPESPFVRERRDISTHFLPVADKDDYWRKTGRRRGVMKAREKCEGLTLSINEPGDSEWVIRSAAAKWQENAAIDPSVDDRVDVVRHLESVGKHITLVLRDGDRRLSGEACIIHDDTVVSVLAYRDAAVGSLPTGVRTMDGIFQYAQDNSFTGVDLGGYREYKRAWAPEAGVRHELLVAPRFRFHARQLLRKVRSRPA